jgi:hypothetical protein
MPERYGETRIVLQVRDPFWMHAYWEIAECTAADLARELGDEIHRSRLTLRVSDVTGVELGTVDSARHASIHVHPFADNWYINACEPDRSYCVDLGLTLASGAFRLIARSNVVRTPRVGPSEIRDEEWLSIRALEAMKPAPRPPYASSPGLPSGKLRGEERLREISMGSGGLGAVSSPAGPVIGVAEVAPRQYWLRADAELIVYGATEPGSHIAVSGMTARVAADGTFSMRMALPIGELPIEVTAESADQLMSRRVSWTVTRTGPGYGESGHDGNDWNDGK